MPDSGRHCHSLSGHSHFQCPCSRARDFEASVTNSQIESQMSEPDVRAGVGAGVRARCQIQGWGQGWSQMSELGSEPGSEPDVRARVLAQRISFSHISVGPWEDHHGNRSSLVAQVSGRKSPGS